MKRFIILFAILFSTLTYGQKSRSSQVIEPGRFEQLISVDDVQLIDVRTPEEYNQGYIKGAENIDFLAEGFLSGFDSLNKKEPVFIYCRSGNRSAKASKQLVEAGFTKVFDLQGGYEAWKHLKENNLE